MARHSHHHTHYPGQCQPGSMGALTCPVCAPYYRAEDDRLRRADEARRAKYGRLSCSSCGRVYKVDSLTGIVEDHACQVISDSQRWA